MEEEQPDLNIDDIEDIDEQLNIYNISLLKGDKLLTLNDSKIYEKYLKKELECLYKDYPEKIKTIINSFNYQSLLNLYCLRYFSC